MKCPKCNKEGLKYIIPRGEKINGKSPPKRTEFKAECKYCGWAGGYY